MKVFGQAAGKVSALVDRSLSESVMAGVVVINPGQGLPAEGYSLHESSDELAYIVEGEVVFGTPVEEWLLREGDLLFNPKGTGHYVRNDAESPCRVVWFLSPPIKL